MSATQIIDFLQANAVLITFDPAVTYPAGYIVEYDNKLYIANDEIPAGTGFLEGNTGASFAVLNPTNGLTDAELRAEPVDVTSSVYIREDRWICLVDGPAPVEYLEGHQLRRMEFFDTTTSTNTFIWFNLSTNDSLTVSPLPTDIIFNGPSTEIKQDVGNQVMNDVKNRLPTSVGLKTEDLSLSVTLSNNNSVMQITQYNVITSGTGYTVGNVLRKTTFFNMATGATTTKWYNVSTTTALTAAPNLAHLTVRSDKIGANGQLPAVLGKLTQAESLSVVVSNTGSAINTSTIFYDVTTDGTGYTIGDVLRCLEIFDAQTKTTATYWYNITTAADIAAPIDADVAARAVSTADQKFALTNSIKFYNATVAGTGYSIGDVLRRLEILDPATKTTSYYWYNVTTGLDVATAPVPANIIAQVDLVDSSVVHQTNTYTVVTDGVGYVVDDIIFEVQSLDPTTGVVSSVWRNVTQDAIIAAPIAADLSLNVAVTDTTELVNTYKFVATADDAVSGRYLTDDLINAYEFFDKTNLASSIQWKNVTQNTVITAPVLADLSAPTVVAPLQYVQLPDSLGKKTQAQSLSVVVANPITNQLVNKLTYTATADNTDYLTGEVIVKYEFFDTDTLINSEVWKNITQDAVITAPDLAEMSVPTVEATLKYTQLPESLGLKTQAQSLSVVVSNPDSTVLVNTFTYTVTTAATGYAIGDVIEAYEIFDKVTLETTKSWKNITQDTILATAPNLAHLSAPSVDSPLVYSQLPTSLGKKTDANSLSVVVSNQDNKVLRGSLTYSVVTADTEYDVGDVLQQYFLLNKETFETEIVWRNATQNTILTTDPVLANLTAGTLSADLQYNQLPDSLGKKAAGASLSVVLATDPTKQLQAVYNYSATVANGVHYSIGDFIRRMDYTDFSTGEVLTTWRNVTQNKTITSIILADFTAVGDSRGLLYTQLPTSLGKKTDANSLSVVVSNATTKVLDSSTTYTATATAVNPAHYVMGDKIGKYDYLDLADSSTSTVWRNLTTSTTIPTPDPLQLGSPVVADPLQYSQLPTALGPQDDADSLSVVVSNPDGKLWMGSDYYEATVADNDYVLGDKITKYNYLDIKNNQFVSTWKNDTTNTVIIAPNMMNVEPISGKNPLDASQLPASLGLKATANSLSVAVANQDPSFVNMSRYVAIADDAVNSLYLADDVIARYTFVNPNDGVVTYKWYNITQESVIEEPLAADITGGASSNPLTYEQLPTSLGKKTVANSLSIVDADAKAPLLHSSRTYVATAASATPGKYEIGEVVRVVDAFDIINQVSMLTLYNLSTNTVIDEFNIADFDRLPPDHLLYTQLPAALGLQDAADSLSVVVADQQNKVVLSVDTYQTYQASVTPGEYAINDIIRRVELQDLSDNTISYVWRNMTTGVVVTNPNILVFNKLSGEPLQYTQLPTTLGLQDAADSLSVVVADQLSDILIEQKSFIGNADQTGVDTNDIVRRFQLYNPVTETTTYKWYNVTQELDIPTPGDLTMLDPYNSDTAVIIKKVVYKTEVYKAITDHATDWLTDDIFYKTYYLNMETGAVTSEWFNTRTNLLLPDEPAPLDVTEIGNKQLPASLGRKANTESLSVVQSNPIGQSMSYFKAITANGVHYSIGDILRRWEIVDLYADEIIVRWTNKTQLKQVLTTNINIAHLQETTATEVAFKSVERVPGFYAVEVDGTIAAGTVAASLFNVGTTDATVAGGTLSPGFVVNFEAPKGDTLGEIVYEASATAKLLINTLT